MDEFEKAQRILSPAGGIPLTNQNYVSPQAERDIAYQREIAGLRERLRDYINTKFPETAAVVNTRIVAVLAKDGVNTEGDVILLRPDTLEELRVLTALIHELR